VSHRDSTSPPPRLREPDDPNGPATVVADDRRSPPPTPEELEGEWLPALLWHHPPDDPFPGTYAVVAQPFLAGADQTGYRDQDGGPLTYLVLFVMGAVGVGAPLSADTVDAAFRETLQRATALAKGVSQEMSNASVRILLARMPEWMARKLVPNLRDLRPT
jgi:hypothetical protein